MNIAEQERYARRYTECRRKDGGCGAQPGQRCEEYDAGYARRRLLGRPHEVRVQAVRKELGIEE
jgi:hypothetical protein